MSFNYQDIEIKKVFKNYKNYLIIDVRSQAEFEKDSLFDSINIPILDNIERHRIGIIFKKEGEQKAKEFARKNILPFIDEKITKIYNKFNSNNKKYILIYCARGGNRSKVMSMLLSVERTNIFRLINGYKGYRRFLIDFFEKAKMPKLKVFYGMTGSGKTTLLNDLSKLKFPVIDLEKLAKHKGSVFGHIGSIEKQPSQKRFETELFFKIKQNYRYFIVEGESQRIGRIVIPNRFYNQVTLGKAYFIEASIQKRVKRLKKEYGIFYLKEKKEILEALSYLTIRLGKITIEKIKNFLENKFISKAIELLLIKHYDLLYIKNNSNKKKFIKIFSSNNYRKCINEIKIEFKKIGGI